MRIDIVTIFPSFFDVLDLSLLGKARQSGLIDVTHDLRDFTHDRHRTVDDTPYGGGAGMVMKPEPWGEALDAIVGDGASDALLVVPSPGGEPFTQAIARELAAEEHVVFACGRYEGIDQRVVDHYGERMRVRLISLGDYVLNGGEVAVMAMIEAAARLVPGIVGNPESLVEESHEDGLLEYPSYTKPARGAGSTCPRAALGQPRCDRRVAPRAAGRAHPARAARAARRLKPAAPSSGPAAQPDAPRVRHSSRPGNTRVPSAKHAVHSVEIGGETGFRRSAVRKMVGSSGAGPPADVPGAPPPPRRGHPRRPVGGEPRGRDPPGRRRRVRATGARRLDQLRRRREPRRRRRAGRRRGTRRGHRAARALRGLPHVRTGLSLGLDRIGGGASSPTSSAPTIASWRCSRGASTPSGSTTRTPSCSRPPARTTPARCGSASRPPGGWHIGSVAR